MRGGQLVEQAALHVRARELVEFLLQLTLHQVPQLINAFKTQ